MVTINRGVIDKLSITFYASYHAHSRIKSSHKLVDVDKLLVGEIKTVVKETGRINSYKAMAWSNVTEEGVVAVKYGRFMKDGGVNYRYLNVEWNPRKTYLPDALLSFLETFGFHIIEINSLDYCVDVHNAKVSDFVFVAPMQSSTMSFGTLGGASSKYLHPKSNNGRVKIYDKYQERASAARKYSSIDPEIYRDITRVEYTFHNMGFVLDYPYEDVSVTKAMESAKWLSQVMLRMPKKYDCSDIDISPVDKYVLDVLMYEGLTEQAHSYIRLKGINQRKKLNEYLKVSHYHFLYINSLPNALRFVEGLRSDLYNILPSYVFLGL